MATFSEILTALVVQTLINPDLAQALVVADRVPSDQSINTYFFHVL